MRGWRVSGLRPIADPFVAAVPAGARVRARLCVSPQDEAVLWAAGTHLGSLAGRDLAARCAEGRLDARGKAGSRTRRKRALTAESSSRWAGAITRTSEDQIRVAGQNLRAERNTLRARIRRIEARLPVPVGGKARWVRGYATPAERHAKAIRLQALQARLVRVDRRLEAGTVSVVRGGKALLRRHGSLAEAGMTEEWRREWESARLFLTADGEKDKAWGNETIRWNPDGCWLEIKLPVPLARLANRPHGRYRLSAPVVFSYRGTDVAAQAASGAVRYDISHEPARGRWYIDASWTAAPVPSGTAGRTAAAPGAGGRPEPRPPRRVDCHPGREPGRAARDDPASPGRAARYHPRREAPRCHQLPDQARPPGRLPGGRDRGPGLR